MNIIPGVGEALTALRPKCEFMLQGSTYADILWLDKDQTIPTEDDVTAKVTELVNAYPMKLLREERDRFLKETDWRASSDLIIPEEWKIYRQRLRDLPAGNSPDLNSDGTLDKTSVNWPTPPS
tara:strand:- start:27 stop:395 length:369 start_codon:yes stop_codon:yes gene_type:complete